MKLSYNVAVCFSGEPRSFLTAASYIKAFLKTDLHVVDLFCHTWSFNTWKMSQGNHLTEELNDLALKNSLDELYSFKVLEVSKPLPDTFIRLKNGFEIHAHSLSQFKSLALSNNFKTQVEIKNKKDYDIVFRMRLDAIPPNTTLDFILSKITKPLTDEVIINQHTSGNTEYRAPWCEDTIFYGSSLGMDIISDLYYYYRNGKFFEMVDCSILNPAISRYGPNALLYKWATMKNIKMSRYDCIHLSSAIPIRYDVQNKSYQEIIDRYKNE